MRLMLDIKLRLHNMQFGAIIRVMLTPPSTLDNYLARDA